MATAPAREEVPAPRTTSTAIELGHERPEVVALAPQLRKLARFFEPDHWRDTADEELEVKELVGGFTNLLYRVSQRGTGHSVLVRIYGKKTELMIDRAEETNVLRALAQAGLGPRFYGVFGNGCAYGYVPGRNLTLDEMPLERYQAAVARLLARWHAFHYAAPREASLFRTLTQWAALAPTEFAGDDKRNRVLQAAEVDVVRREMATVERRLRDLASPVVFAHNDLLAGNILWSERDDSLGFIDFEYSGYNYRGFDLGNHFCEYMGFPPEPHRYPSRDVQLRFLRHYARAAHELSAAASSTTAAAAAAPTPLTDEQLDAEVERLYVEANQFALAAHLFWGFWALVQAVHSQIDFDYVDYAAKRFRAYHRNKDAFWALNKPSGKPSSKL